MKRAARRQVFRDVPPLAARAQYVHETVDDRTHVHPPLAPAALGRRNKRLNHCPLIVAQVARVSQIVAVVLRAVLVGPHRQPLPSRLPTVEPSARGDFRLALVSLLQRIRSRALFPGQDGDPRGLILIITAASMAVQWSRFSSCRSTVRPSSFHLTQTSATRRR